MGDVGYLLFAIGIFSYFLFKIGNSINSKKEEYDKNRKILQKQEAENKLLGQSYNDALNRMYEENKINYDEYFEIHSDIVGLNDADLTPAQENRRWNKLHKDTETVEGIEKLSSKIKKMLAQPEYRETVSSRVALKEIWRKERQVKEDAHYALIKEFNLISLALLFGDRSDHITTSTSESNVRIAADEFFMFLVNPYCTDLCRYFFGYNFSDETTEQYLVRVRYALETPGFIEWLTKRTWQSDPPYSENPCHWDNIRKNA